MLNFSRRYLAVNLAAVLGLSALVGCESTPNDVSGNAPTAGAGSVALVLSGGAGVVNAFSYSITGPNSYSGSINVANSATVSALIGGIAAGSGYALSITGASTDGKTSCAGASASFSVSAGATTSVSVVIDCKAPGKTGSVAVNGTINICPNINSVSANPPVGNTIALASSASDPDGGPQPVSYSWTTSSGTLSSATAQNPTLTCTAPGTATLTLTVSDGDAGCATSFSVPVTCPSDASLGDTAWVEIGANNQAIARLLTPYNVCPSITVDGVTSPMTVRVLAGAEPLRTSSTDTTLAAAMTSGNTKASVFTTTTCEFAIPSGAKAATVAGISLPLPKAAVNRVAIIGDTGCRISIGNVYQACGDPTQWPYPVIASAAAAMQPDLVLHVGDYEYRDNPCPPGNTACAGQPWGYGSDAWMADFFTPSAPLLAAAPWVMVRGNHEVCNRAGQGWFRYLDINPFDTTDVKTCDNSANDSTATGGNYNDPWAVSFGDTQFIAFDSSNVSKSAYSPAAFQPYTAQLAEAAALATPSLLNIWAVHHPVLGYSAANPPTLGSPGLQSVMNAAYPNNYYPANIGLAMHGHVHDFQAFDFSSNHPATFVAGNGGDNLDNALPAAGTGFNPNNDLPAPNTVVNAFAFSQEFGFMIMDRVGQVGDKNWKFTSYRTNGTIIAVCTMAPAQACSGTCDSTPGSRISCTDGSGNVVGTYDNIP
ncbi:MAG TPA: metallophosphoesterase [Polyangia bacterium]|nr:metallophosphoesterase [Polyangia bacterium]